MAFRTGGLECHMHGELPRLLKTDAGLAMLSHIPGLAANHAAQQGEMDSPLPRTKMAFLRLQAQDETF